MRRQVLVSTWVACAACVIVIAGSVFISPVREVCASYGATTTVSLTVCGDALVSGVEVCDDGTNTGVYGSSIAGKHCTPLCRGWGPYCGDGIVQTVYGEECDDANNTAGDLCDALCQNEQPPITEGGGGGGGVPGGGGGRSGGKPGIQGASTEGNIAYTGSTDLVISGRAYPGATVTVLRDGTLSQVIEADGSGQFSIRASDQTPGITSYGFWALDGANRRSVTYTATFQIIQNAVTTLSGVLIPPTLAITPEKVAPGGSLTFSGYAAPSTDVHVYLDGANTFEATRSAGNGMWSIAYDTTPLTVEMFHTAKAHYLDPTNTLLKSGYSALLNFYVGTKDVATGLTADLNGDGLVNLTDFSILLFNWNTSAPVADINKDGSVSLPDFSIMLFQWTG